MMSLSGAQSVLVLQWLVPDDALQKFFHHFYMALQNGCLLSTAVKTAMDEVRQSKRSVYFCYLFCLQLVENKPTGTFTGLM